MICQDVQAHLPLYLYGELSFDQEETLDAHLDGCPACRDALARERLLHETVDSCAEEPSPVLLAACRRDLLASIPQSRPSLWQRWADLGRIWKPAAAMALLAVGFLAGRADFSQPSVQAASRVRNVEPAGDGSVRIVLEDVRQRTVSGNVNTEAIRRLLLEAAQDPADPGLRVESMGILQRESELADVRRTLLAAATRDPNPGVRLKALEGLREHAREGDVRRTMAQVLLRDDNVGVRTVAIDVLTAHHAGDLIGLLQQVMHREENDYIRGRIQRALRDMNASVETF